MKLSDIKITQREVVTVDVDMSQCLGEGITLTLKEPDAAAAFGVSKAATKVRINHPHFPVELCQSVAMLGTCHVAPETGDIDAVSWYASLAKSERDAFFHVLNAFNAGMTSDLTTALDEAKND